MASDSAIIGAPATSPRRRHFDLPPHIVDRIARESLDAITRAMANRAHLSFFYAIPYGNIIIIIAPAAGTTVTAQGLVDAALQGTPRRRGPENG
ncbi:hypothetical protein E8E14_002476 [Neopestalotiopsis sp. 37M]|nr:hypothetical protein E8E14_002476 [Neopestalotiopsis sp. 37M]